jgi:hypothetical protein
VVTANKALLALHGKVRVGVRVRVRIRVRVRVRVEGEGEGESSFGAPRKPLMLVCLFHDEGTE